MMKGSARGTRTSGSPWVAVIVAAVVASVALWGFPLVAQAEPAAGGIVAGTAGASAYGGVHTFNVTWQGLRGQYVGTATYGFVAMVNRTNTSATTFVLTENHTVGAVINLTYCRPSCANAKLVDHYFYRSWETWDVQANFTTNATLSIGGVSVPALGLVSSNATFRSNVTQFLTQSVNGTLRLLDRLYASAYAQYSIAFTPALPLFPLNLSLVAKGHPWQPQVTFVSSGTWSAQFQYIGPAGHVTTGSQQGTLSGHGIVLLLGGPGVPPPKLPAPLSTSAAPGPTALNLGIELQGIGGSAGSKVGFDLEDGFVFVPHAVNLLAGGAPPPSGPNPQPWNLNAVGNTTAASGVTEVGPSSLGANSFVDSTWNFTTGVSNPDPTPQNSTETVNGSPMTAAQASQASSCLQAGTCATTAPLAGSTGSLLTVFVGIGGAVVVAAVVALLVAQRRRMPPPTYPNSGLYPPGGRSQGAAAPAPPPPPPGPGDESDPLDNLW